VNFLTISLFVSLCPGRGYGQGYQEAEIEHNRGELLLEMKDYPRAIFAFKKAYGIMPDLRYLSGLARAYAAKGDPEKALIHGQTYLARAGENPDARVVRAVANARAKVTATASRVDLSLFPSGGRLTFVLANGERQIRVPESDRVTRWLPHGDTVVTYEKEGFEPRTAKFEVLPEKVVDVAVELARTQGESELVVVSNLEDALVYLDGKEAGKTPFKQRVPAGDHVIQVWSRNHLAWSGVVDAPANRSVDVNATLVPARERVNYLPVPRLMVEEPSRFWSLSTWGWITMGAGVGALGGAGYFYTVWQTKWAEVSKAASGSDEQQRLYDESMQVYLATLGSAIAGGVLVGGGLLMVLLDSGDELEESSPFELLTLSPAMAPGGLYLDATFSF